MYFLTYVSCAVAPFTNDQLRDLLVISERNNRRDEISGMLLYKDGNFLQVLEGTEDCVRQTYARIKLDMRHDGLITLLQGPQKERQFSSWSMGFRDLGSAVPKPAGYSEFMNSPLTGAEFAVNPSRAHDLLMMFRNST